jgi:hypothetical protein
MNDDGQFDDSICQYETKNLRRRTINPGRDASEWSRNGFQQTGARAVGCEQKLEVQIMTNRLAR